jgi:hypothetical protein
MNLEYTYRITNVSEDARSMEIVYTSPVYGTLRVGARLPWRGETIAQVVEMYNPTRYWLDTVREIEPVAEGLTGSQSVEVFDPDAPAPEPSPEEVRAMIQAKRLVALQLKADPLFFKWQAGEGTKEEWLAKRKEILASFPFPEADA